MNGLRLALPTPADEQKVWAYREEFLNHVSSMDGTGGLAEAQSFEQWYSRNLANRCEQTVQPGFVPATTF
ncbi:MAG: GNAT family N-acetyltransferase, partial [Negativibacillus sp.]|nr:GNAT family N-acetyltransferase [Negativibacillus sp.]